MLRKSDHSLLLEIESSKIFVSVVQVIHTLALVACIVSSIPGWSKAILCLLIIYSFGYIYHNYVIQSPVRKLTYSNQGGWKLICKEFAGRPITILGSTVTTPMLTILQFLDQNHTKQSIIIWSDALKRDSYRQMCVTLKITVSTQ